jgi:CheY-like chemotaxis protein
MPNIHSSVGAGKPHRLLVIDDHSDTRKALGKLLGYKGCEVTVAGTLQEARELCAGVNFDTILCDITLPDGSGLDFPRWIKARGTGTRVIALTGRAMPAEIRAMTDAGFDSILLKPLVADSLFELVDCARRDSAAQ